MWKSLIKIERDALVTHLLFSVLCALTLAIPIDIKIGFRILTLVVIYNTAMPVFGLLRGYEEWVKLWLFAFILSLFQVWPDWFLSAELGILGFHEDGLMKIGSVSSYMAGLWTIPLFVIIFIGQRIQERYSRKSAYWAVALSSLAIFGGSEQTMWMIPSWYAQNVTIIGHVAVYIIIPEIILGLTTYGCYEMIKTRSYWLMIPAAFTVMQLYLGSAAFFYFLIERVLIGY